MALKLFSSLHTIPYLLIFLSPSLAAVPESPSTRVSPETICKSTPYPSFCKTFLSPNGTGNIYDYGRFSARRSLSTASTFLSLVDRYLSRPSTLSETTIRALEDCRLLAGLNMDFLSSAIQTINSTTNLPSLKADDVQTFLSAILTNQQTCLEGLESTASAGSVKNGLTTPLSNGTKQYSVSLALFSRGWVHKRKRSQGRKLLFADMEVGRHGRLPLRMSSRNREIFESVSRRHLLQTSTPDDILVRDMVVVSQDGTGNFTTINDAVEVAPNKTDISDGYFLIYVVSGVYEENVSIIKNKRNLMMMGDGINQTVITGNRSVVDGWTTFNSATFAVVGQGFVAVNITFRNTAGAIKHQAVAVRNGADLSTFYSCSFEGYQDTLYTHSLRQFYRECDIYGTVDFIFGNAAVVLQNCNLYPRLPMQGQFNAITAQGRIDPNQNTGTSIHNCTIRAADDLASSNGTTKTYLGRPWKEYSRTVYMQSFMDSLIDPTGWREWSGDFALSTLYYAEFNNTGPGSVTTNRVTWPGYLVIDAMDAANFTVSNFIIGDDCSPVSKAILLQPWGIDRASQSNMSLSAYGHVSGENVGNGAKRKKRFAIIGVASLILVAMVVAVAVGVSRSHGGNGKSGGGGEMSTSMKAIKVICQPTDYKEACIDSLSSTAGNTTNPKDLIKVAFKVAMNHINDAVNHSAVLIELEKDPRASQALNNCHELMDYAIDDLQNSFERLGGFDISKFDDLLGDLKIWLSAAITYQETCLDGFENTTSNAGESMRKALKTAGELTSNSLAIVTDISSVLTSLQVPILSRRLLSEESELPVPDNGEFPSWVSGGKRRLLAAVPEDIKPDVVVAKDGSGMYKTINEALNDIPVKSNLTFVIYIKEGVYEEEVQINKTMTHVMMIGDGPTKTKITGSKNFIDGTPTFKTATVAVLGEGFIGKDIGFENTAGAAKHQAVALRVQSDMSIFYNCQMDAYQDTLYTHTHRQFYRDCTISGTIDFIFGNAAAVFQNCKMVVRKPLENQQCIVTAQGRKERREPTALVLQNCTITADPLYFPLRKTIRSYLGRPWKEYSRTIIMQSQIDDLIQPEGWLPWMGDFALNTCFYTEYSNRGPGAAMEKRVTWRGIKKLTPQHAVDFTAGRFIKGDSWIKPTGIPYTSGLSAV
ncbi:hypothetical protein HHK36_020814 [Tetracentron sinense]|uniref:pectinesterase n=1 Tax=Tetracentron sinense TaxID=13715 RepID=A0A834YVT6_TETSI|nr:hypothetical protein HHK36_020814 [Tetracentron sinense]